jgi:hypothetical protein
MRINKGFATKSAKSKHNPGKNAYFCRLIAKLKIGNYGLEIYSALSSFHSRR